MTTKQLDMTTEEFLDKLETFLHDTVGENWFFDWRGDEDESIDFRSFYVWGFKYEPEDDDEEYED